MFELTTSSADVGPYYLICFISILAIVPFFIIIRSKKSKPVKGFGGIRVPPEPLAMPIIGHLHLLNSCVLARSLQTLAIRYGPLITVKMGPTSFLLVSKADVAMEVFKTHDVTFASRVGGASTSGSIIKDKGGSFFAAEYGSYWKFMKKLCMSELLSATQISALADIRKQEMTSLLETILECSRKERACNLSELFLAMTNNMICRMAMSTRTSKDADSSARMRKIVRDFERFAPKVIFGGLYGFLGNLEFFQYKRRFADAYMQYDSMMNCIIAEHETNADESRRKDLIDVMLEIGKVDAAQVKLNKQNIKAVTLDIFLGATGSTASAVLWVLAELINHPDVLKKVRDEINDVVGQNRLVDEKDVHHLLYLQAVVKEVLRLHPVTPLINRRCREQCNINGYDILPNTRVLINVYAIMRDPNLWHEPNKFVPERFLVNSSGNGVDRNGNDWGHRVDTPGHNFEYLPFGGGRRRCPGAGLASVIIHVVVAALVQCFDWKAKNGGNVNMEEGPGIGLSMAHPMECCPSVRIDPFIFSST